MRKDCFNGTLKKDYNNVFVTNLEGFLKSKRQECASKAADSAHLRHDGAIDSIEAFSVTDLEHSSI
jgi:hypothetical protein